MATINIDDETMEIWEKFYKEQDLIEYPSLKNFTIKKMRELAEQNKVKKEENDS